jgi:GxxExxY protein
MSLKSQELTETIIKVFYEIYGKLGYGFLEQIYEKAMMIEFEKAGIQAVSQSPIKVIYDGNTIGEYFADILVEDEVIVEIKATKNLAVAHEAQVLNYLKDTEIEVGLLLNFGPKHQIKRKVFDNNKK